MVFAAFVDYSNYAIKIPERRTCPAADPGEREFRKSKMCIQIIYKIQFLFMSLVGMLRCGRFQRLHATAPAIADVVSRQCNRKCVFQWLHRWTDMVLGGQERVDCWHCRGSFVALCKTYFIYFFLLLKNNFTYFYNR